MTFPQDQPGGFSGGYAGETDERDGDLFQAAFEAAGAAMMVIGPERGFSEATIGFVNREMTALTGYPAHELVGCSPRILQGPDSDPRELKRRRRHLEEQRRYTGETINYRKDGSTYVGGWNITAIPGPNGSVRGWLAIGRDETPRRRTLEALSAVKARHQALLEAIPHLVWQSRDGGDWFAASPQWVAFTGQGEEASRGAGWRAMVLPQDLLATDTAWRLACETGVMTVEHRIRRHDGIYRWFQTAALPVPADAPRGRERQWIGTSTDIDDLRGAEERVRYLAFHDVLTDAGNRAMLREALERMTEAGADAPPFNVLYLDVDDFKRVNDQLGHRGGDEVLREISRQLIGWLRQEDILARVGGDEFVLVQAGTDASEGRRLADRIRHQLKRPLAVGESDFQVNTSIGIASCPTDGLNGEELLRRADLALFEAKTEKRTGSGSGVRAFEPRMEAAREEYLALRTGLAHAIERGELALAYQPVCNAGTRAVCAFEALARWTHGQRGPVAPDAFIPIAEESGLIVPIGQWVLVRACLDAVTPPFAGRRIAVNLSPAQLRSGTLARTIEAALHWTGLAPERLELEVTERLLMDTGEGVDRTLREIKAMGVGIALDDFGTGYSNLGYLCRFPFDRLKIDQSFVRQMEGDQGARAVVGGIVALAHSLRLQVTAEGVETEAQLAMLRDMGCDQVQGYLLGRPAPAGGSGRD